MKYIASMLFLISCCTNFAADTQQVKQEQKQNRMHKLLKVAVPVVAATVGVGVLAYIKHQQIPDLNSINVHTKDRGIISLPINGDSTFVDLWHPLSHSYGMNTKDKKFMIGFRKYFYSL